MMIKFTFLINLTAMWLMLHSSNAYSTSITTEPILLPNRAGIGCLDLLTIDLDMDGRNELIEVGAITNSRHSFSLIDQSTNISNGRPRPILPINHRYSGIDASSEPPFVVMFGASGGTLIRESIEVFNGIDLERGLKNNYRIGNSVFDINLQSISSNSNFEFFVASFANAFLFSSSNDEPIWHNTDIDGFVSDYITIEADDIPGNEIILPTESGIYFIDPKDGQIKDSYPSFVENNTFKIISANLTEDESDEFIIHSITQNIMKAYEPSTGLILWETNNNPADSITSYDLNGDGLDEVLIAKAASGLNNGQLSWLDNLGNVITTASITTGSFVTNGVSNILILA